MSHSKEGDGESAAKEEDEVNCQLVSKTRKVKTVIDKLKQVFFSKAIANTQ